MHGATINLFQKMFRFVSEVLICKIWSTKPVLTCLWLQIKIIHLARLNHIASFFQKTEWFCRASRENMVILLWVQCWCVGKTIYWLRFTNKKGSTKKIRYILKFPSFCSDMWLKYILEIKLVYWPSSSFKMIRFILMNYFEPDYRVEQFH
jgi:hypothetical protein